MIRTLRWLASILIVVSPISVWGQSADLLTDLAEARRIYVPVEDLDVIIERDKQGVLLPRAKFDVLLTQAKANADKNAVPAGVPVVMTVADYAARIVGDQLLISVTGELTQFDNDWHESRFALQRLSLEQVRLDDAPALVGRHPDGSVSLFTDSRGTHTLKLQLSTELTAMGSDQVAAFSLLKAPSGSLTLSLPAGKRLLIGTVQLERPASLDQVADYKIAVGGTGGLQLRITDRAAENAADSLTFATTGYGLHVAPGEVTWHALTTLQVFGKAIDRMTFSVPSKLEIADVEATGLESWALSDDPNDAGRTVITLTFGQAFDGARKVALKGVMAVETGKPWTVPPLRIENVTSHIGQVLIQYPAGVRLRVEEAAGVRRATEEQKPAADMPDDMPKLSASESLRFDAWQSDFTLRLTTQPKQREVQAAVAAVLDVNATGLELEVALTVETHFAPLFEVDIRLPSEWQVVNAQSNDKPLKWQLVGLDEVGINQLRILLDPALPMDGTGQIRLSLRREVEGWPVDSNPIVLDLPELLLPQSSLTEGAFVVRGDDDLDLEASDLTGLDPQPLKADYERLRFQSQDTRYSGKLKITRKPSRVAAQTVTVARIDPQNFHAFLQALIEVQGGGIRTIKVALPEATGTALRFECPGPRIVEQKSAAPANGERIWTLQFDQRLRGQALITCDVEVPRGDEKEFVVPQWRFLDVERQNGFFAVEAGSEQRLTIVAKNADGSDLADVDPLDLPTVYYQPKERLVAVYRAAASGTVLTLSEQKFEKLPVPTAICPLLEISTIVGQTGELQQRATFHLNVVGVQGLHVTFPSGTTLWATLVDGSPVEVRRSGDVYLVPLALRNVPNSPVPSNESRVAQFFYRSEVPALSQFGTLKQEAPSLTVESGQRTALPVEVLEQKWDVHYPEETRLVDSRSPLEPDQPMDRMSFLANWNTTFHIPTPTDFGWDFLAVLVAITIVALLGYGYRRHRLILTQLVVVLVCVGVLFFMAFSANERKSAEFYGEASRDFPPAGNATPALAKSPVRTSRPQEPTSAMGRPTLSLVETMNDTPMAAESQPSAPEQSLEFQVPPGMKQAPGPMVGGPGRGMMGGMGGMRIDPNGKDEPAKQAADGIAQNELPPPDFVDPGRDEQFASGKLPRSRALGLLSLAIEFLPPAGNRQKTFHYVGADPLPSDVGLEVDYVDRHSGAAIRIFVIALVVLLGWLLRKGCERSKIAMATLGIVTPLAMFPFVPMTWQVILDGVFLGTIATIVLWLIRGCVLCCSCCNWQPVKTKAVGGVLAIATLLTASGTVFAAEKAGEPNAKPVAEVRPGTTLVIPFDAGTEPLASERVFLSHEQFLQLYRLANPDKVTKQPAPQAGGILEALFAAKLVSPDGHPEESTVHVNARFAVRSFVDGQLLVELPVGQVSARDAKLDGQTAALVTNAGCFKVAVSKPGLHVIDFEFDLPAKLSGSTGAFTLPLLPTRAGKLTFELPAKDLSIRVNGSSTIFRRVTDENVQTVEFPVDKGGDVSIAWQPQQAVGAAAAIVQVDSVEAVTLTDAGVAVSHGFSYRVRQGGVADTSFSLPDNLRLQAVNGPDVGGWELQGAGDARKLRVIFRRNVTDQTRLAVETFLDVKVGAASTVISVPQVAPQQITNEIGQVAVYAGNQFTIRAEQVESLTQVDSDKFATQIPVSRPNVPPQLAYRFSKRPFTLNLRATRQESQAHVTAQQAAFVTLRKQQLTTRLRINLTGAPRSSLSVSLPENFVLLDVQASALRDWYIAKNEGGSTLTIELNSPRLGLTEVVLGGFTPREGGDGTVSIQFPQPLDVSRVDSTAAVWLDDGFNGTLDSFNGWRSVDASNVNPELQAVKAGRTVQFAFASTAVKPGPIELTLTQTSPKLSANGLSMVTVTDVAVIDTLALQWQIDTAKIDTLTLTTPDWLAGKLDFQGPGLREVTQSDAGGGRTRWTIHLRSPVSGKYFATAIATLPAPAKEVLAPALVFEQDQKALDAQRQYVLLINSSLSQLTSVDTSLIESVQREDVPVIVQQEFVDQATELVRVKALLTAPRWSLHNFAKEHDAPASVNVADLVTVLSRDGTYRAVAIYTIKNRSRQFLALQMPEKTELLSVFVNGMPSRAVTAKLPSLKGSSAQLVALPKTSAASLSFPVKIVWRGSLNTGLPRSARLMREEFSVPAPRILSQQEDPDFGIPVATTRWTVYLPDDLDALPVRSNSRFNMSLSQDSDSPYARAYLQELSELLDVSEQVILSNRRSQSVNNLKQIGVATDNAKQLGQALENYRGAMGVEFEKSKADVLKRMSEIDRMAQDESRKTNEYFAKSNQTKPGSASNVYQAEGLAEGEILAQEQRKSLSALNITADTTLKDNSSSMSVFNFELQVKDAEIASKSEKKDSSKESGAKNANPTNETRRQFKSFNDVNLDALNSVVNSNSAMRNNVSGQPANVNGTQIQGAPQGQLLQQNQFGLQGPYSQQGLPGAGFGVSNQTFITNGSILMSDGTLSNNGLADNPSVWNSPAMPGNSASGLIPGMGNSVQFGGMGGGNSSGQQGQGGFGGGQFGSGGGAALGMTASPQNVGGGFRAGSGRRAGGGGMPRDNSAPVSGPVGLKSHTTRNLPANRPQQQMDDMLALDADGEGRIVEERWAKQLGEGRDNAFAANAPLAWRQAGGLSLDIELPKSGRKLVFTKVGGDPKLALAVRPQESMRWGIGVLWSAIWIVFGVSVLATLRHPSAVHRLLSQLPWAVAILGIVGFFALPGPLRIGSFVLFVIGALIVAFRKRTTVATS